MTRAAKHWFSLTTNWNKNKFNKKNNIKEEITNETYFFRNMIYKHVLHNVSVRYRISEQTENIKNSESHWDLEIPKHRSGTFFSGDYISADVCYKHICTQTEYFNY